MARARSLIGKAIQAWQPVLEQLQEKSPLPVQCTIILQTYEIHLSIGVAKLQALRKEVSVRDDELKVMEAKLAAASKQEVERQVALAAR